MPSICVAVLDELLSFGDERAYVIESLLVFRVREDLVPGSDWKRFLRSPSSVKDTDCGRASWLEPEILPHVDLLLDEFVCLGEPHRLVKAGQVLIDSDLLRHHGEAPFLETVSEDFPNGEESEPEYRHD